MDRAEPERADPIDEGDLVDRARSDPEAFAELYRRHLPDIHRFLARRTGSIALAEDLTAATFEKALRGIAGYRPERGGFGGWLHTIAAHELVDHQRRASRAGRDAVRAAERRISGASGGVAPDEVVLADLAPLREALDRLSERYRTILALRYFSDLGHDGAVAASGLSRNHFAVVLHRAKAALRRELDRLEVSDADR